MRISKQSCFGSTQDTQAKVGIQFTVDTIGKINCVFIFSSREWSLDNEAIRVVKNSSLWNPDIYKKNKVLFTYRQKIIVYWQRKK